jgi:hypothetical protein
MPWGDRIFALRQYSSKIGLKTAEKMVSYMKERTIPFLIYFNQKELKMKIIFNAIGYLACSALLIVLYTIRLPLVFLGYLLTPKQANRNKVVDVKARFIDVKDITYSNTTNVHNVT